MSIRWKRYWKRRFGARPRGPQRQARQVWHYLYPGEPFPRRLRVEWACSTIMRRYQGVYYHDERRIYLRWDRKLARMRGQGCASDVVLTLIHEFVHARHRGLRHGREFDRLVYQAGDRLGIRVATILLGKMALQKRRSGGNATLAQAGGVANTSHPVGSESAR